MQSQKDQSREIEVIIGPGLPMPSILRDLGQERGLEKTEMTTSHDESSVRAVSGIQNYLRRLYGRVCDSLGVEPNEDHRNAFVRESVRKIDDPTAFARRLGLAADEGATGGTGKRSRVPEGATFDEIVIEVRRSLLDLAQDGPRLSVFIHMVLPDYLDYVEGLPGVTPENRADLVLMCFTMRRAERATESLGRFVARVRGHLDVQDEDDRRVGFYQTLAGLGDVLLMPQAKDLYVHAVYYYHEVISHFWRGCESGQRLNDDGLVRIRNCIFNTIIIIMEVLQRGGRQVAAHGLEAFARAGVMCQARIHAVDRTAREMGEPASEKYVSRVLGVDPGNMRREHLACIEGMARLHAVWPWLGLLERPLFQIAAACAIVGQDKHDSTVPSRLFNATVSLLRARNEARDGSEVHEDGALHAAFIGEKAVRARGVLAGLGLYAALNEGVDLTDVFVERSGLSCAVNCYAACSDLTLSAADRDALAELVASMSELQVRASTLPREAQTDMERLSASLRGMNLETHFRAPGGEQFNKTKAIECARDALRALLKGFGREEHVEIGLPDWRDDVSAAARFAFVSAFGEERIDQASGLLLQKVGSIVKDSAEVETALQKAYAEFASPAWGEPGKPLLAKVAELGVDDTRWKQVARECVIETPSLADAIRRGDQPDWW